MTQSKVEKTQNNRTWCLCFA